LKFTVRIAATEEQYKKQGNNNYGQRFKQAPKKSFIFPAESLYFGGSFENGCFYGVSDYFL
jgi:hypothetical protein